MRALSFSGSLSVVVRNVNDSQTVDRIPELGSDVRREVAQRSGPTELPSLGPVMQ